MGAEELYFAGMDGYLGGDSLFYIEDENCDNEYMAKKHYENQEYISQLRQCAEEAGLTFVIYLARITSMQMQ